MKQLNNFEMFINIRAPLIVFSFLAALSNSCTTNSSEKQPKQEHVLDDLDTVSPSTLKDVKNDSIQYIYKDVDIDFIKEKSKPRETVFRVRDTDTSRLIPKQFLENYIFDLPIYGGFNTKIPRDEYALFHFNDFYEAEKAIFFTIIYSNEYCCKEVYGIRVDKKSKRISGTIFIGLDGGDGGWSRRDTGVWKNDSTLDLVEIEMYEDEESSPIKYDTTWRRILISDDRPLRKDKIDSTHFEEKIKE